MSAGPGVDTRCRSFTAIRLALRNTLRRRWVVIDMLRDAFAANLALAGEKFRNGRSGSDGGRTGVALALASLIRHVRDTRPDVEADLETVVVLAAKLGDVDVGKVDRMFKPPKKRKGRPPPTLQRKSLKQILSVAVAILMDGRWAEPDAENYVSSKLEEYDQDIAGPTIGKWRSYVDAYLPRGVGRPGRPDKSGVAIVHPDEVGLYLEHWRSWRISGGQHCVATKQPIMSAKEWVDAFLLNDKLRAFFD